MAEIPLEFEFKALQYSMPSQKYFVESEESGYILPNKKNAFTIS